MSDQVSTPSYLFVLPWSLEHLGGVNQVVISLSKELKRQGVVRPLVLILDWTAKVPIFGTTHGIDTVTWQVRDWYPDYGLAERLKYLIWNYTFARRFRRFCLKQNVLAINPHFPTVAAFSLQLATARMIPKPHFVYSFHGSDVNSLKDLSPARKSVWREMLQSSKAVVTCSKNLSDVLSQAIGPMATTKVIYNGVDISKLKERDSVAIAKTTRRKLISIGKYDPIKGQDVLLNAFLLISDTYTDVDLVMIGATGTSLDTLVDFVTTRELQNRVQFIQNLPHSQIAEYLKNATAFVLASRREGFPLVLLEAGSFGLPVIATRVGGIPELITDRYSGFLVDADAPNQLADMMRYVLDNSEEANQTGQRLMEKVQSGFTWELAAKSYQSLLGTDTH